MEGNEMTPQAAGRPLAVVTGGGGAVTKDNKPVVSSTAPKADTSGPSAADKAGLASKIQAMKEAALDELSKGTLQSYIDKSYDRFLA